MYVATSRANSLNGLYLVGKFNLSAMRANPRIIHEYCRMRNDIRLLPNTVPYILHKSLILILLKTRSLNNHAIDVLKDKRLIETDILCLTVIHITLGQNAPTPEDRLSQFQFCHNKSRNKFQSLAFVYRDNIIIALYDKMPKRSFITFSKAKFMNSPFKLLLLYHKNTENLNLFYENLGEINAYQTLDIILENFNTNALEPDS